MKQQAKIQGSKGRFGRWARRLLLACGFALGLFAGGTAAADGLIIVHPPFPPHPGPVPPPWHPPVVPPGHFAFAPLEVVYHHVNVEIKDQVATTSVDQEFFNPNNERLEGTYIFPLPPGAHIDKFAMDIDGKMVEAELLPADKARALYEEIVRKMKDPALLEYVGRDAFKVRVFPIEPRGKKQIKIRYTQILKNDSGLVEYSYPLNTEKFSAAPIRDVSVKVTLDGKLPLKSVYCPSHTAEVRRDGERRAVVGFEAKEVRPDTDFKVVFSRQANPLGIDLVCSRGADGEGYFMLLASPGMTAPKEGVVQPKDICFVLDTSGSMAGAKLDQAKKALRFCLANLGEKDRFEIVRFSTEAEPLFGRLADADKANLAKAEAFIAGLKPIGGTSIGDALEKALALRGDRKADGARPYHVIFLTDGQPTIGETREDPLVDQVKKADGAGTRIFAFGIGNDVNTHLLDRIAAETRAISQYVLPNEDLEVKLSNFYSKIKEPVLCNLALAFTNPEIRVTQLYPNALPDLFNGDMLLVFGRYSGKGAAAVKITGVFNGKPHEFTADVAFAESAPGNEYIAQMWATRRVGWLLDEIRMHGESAELKDEVTRLARQFGIVTPYTAYLIVEDEKRRDVPVARRNFQELERDRMVLREAEERVVSLKAEAAAPGARAGAPAVMNAQDIADFNTSAVPLQVNGVYAGRGGNSMKKGASSPAAPAAGAVQGYRASQTQAYSQQARVVNGRSFYQNGNVWNDSTAQAQANLKQVDVRFNSDEYFALQRKYPHAVQWFALGNNVDIVLDGTLYQIRE